MLPKYVKNSIMARDWGLLRHEWRAAFTDYSDIGYPPNSSLKEIVAANSSILLPTKNKKNTITLTSGHLRTTALREAIFLTHKSGALLRSFNRDLERSDTTYPEITAYTASYFLAKSLSMLLGLWVTSTKTNGSNWLLDMSGNGNSTATVYQCSCPIGHLHVWDLLKKGLHETSSSPLDGEFLSFCGGLAAEEFAQNRNNLQYNNCEWTYDDLHAHDESDTSWIMTFDRSIYSNADPDDTSYHFGVRLFLMLYRANYQLITDISEGIDTLEKELEKIENNVKLCSKTLKLESWIEH
tara:strand:- start:5104 stop:5991 length:888 start_codon:yes stop_codon:yes gene_type:complete